MNASISRYLNYTKGEIEAMDDDDFFNTICHVQVLLDQEEKSNKTHE